MSTWSIRHAPPFHTPIHPILTSSKPHHASTTTHSTTTITTTKLSLKPLHNSGPAARPQNKHLKRLADVATKSKAPSAISVGHIFAAAIQRNLKRLADAATKSQAPSAISVNRVLAAAIQRDSRLHPLKMRLRTPAKQRRVAQQLSDAFDEQMKI